MPQRSTVMLTVFICLLVLPWAARADTTAQTTAQSEVERMLTAVGGRAAWASVRNTVNDSQQNRVAEPAVVRSVITMDFDRPRLRIDTSAPGLHLARAVDGDRHWRRSRTGELGPMTDEQLASERRFHAGHVYRTLHRLAKRDPALSVALGAGGRIEVFDQGGARIAWYLLDVRGEPYRHGAHDDDTGNVFGPWEHMQGGIRHPLWVSSPDGTWRAMLKELRVNVVLDDATFAMPQR
jgi:hypothetical protein